MQFLDNRVRFLYPNFLVYMGEILLQFWTFFKNYSSFLQSYGCINILCHIFNSARNNLHQRVIFIVKKHVIINTKISQVVHFSVCSKCPSLAFTQARSLFGKLNMALLIESCGSWSPLQNFLEFIDVLRLGLKRLVAFKHSSPNMVVQRVEARRVQRPFTFTNEFAAVGSNLVLSQLLEDKAGWQNISAILNKFRQQSFNRKFSIHFGLVWNEMQSFLPTETDARRNLDVSENYKLLLIIPCIMLIMRHRIFI